MINVRLSNGDYLVTDKDVTGFCWPEEERAGKYTLADQPFDTYVVEDGRLITGQNPGSAKAVAGAVVKQLS